MALDLSAVDLAVTKVVTDAVTATATPLNAQIVQLKAQIAALQAGQVIPPVVPPVSGSWPNASNTGHGSTVLKPSGSIVISTPGTVVSGLDISGTVTIAADNCTLKNCRVRSAVWAIVRINNGVKGAVVDHCTIDGIGTGNDGDGGIVGIGTFTNNNIFNVENGIIILGNYAPSVITDNYIHDMLASGSPHYDGIQIDGGNGNITIRHNTIANNHNQAGAVMIDNYFGPINNIVVDNNILTGGSFTIYVDGQFNSNPITNVVITNNHVGGGLYGSTDFNKTSPTYTGNVEDGPALLAKIL